MPGTVAALPMFADLVVESGPVEGPPSMAKATSEAKIVVGDIVVHAGTDADEVLLTRSIRAARAAAS